MEIILKEVTLKISDIEIFYDWLIIFIEPFPKQLNLDSSKMKEFSNLNWMKTEKSSPQRLGNIVGKKEKLLITSNFSFSHSVFKKLVLQTSKNQCFFGKGLIYLCMYICQSVLPPGFVWNKILCVYGSMNFQIIWHNAPY